MPDEDYLVTHIHQLVGYLNRMGVVTILTNELPTVTGERDDRDRHEPPGRHHVLLKSFEFEGGLRKAAGVIKRRLGAHERIPGDGDHAPGDPRRRGAPASGASSGARPESGNGTRGGAEARGEGRTMDDGGAPPGPAALGWSRDRELVGRLLDSLGAECLALEPATDLRRLVAEERLDLVLADSYGGRGPLGDLLETLDGLPEGGELPMVLLAEAAEVPMLAELATRRFHAALLAKPVEPASSRRPSGRGCATGRAGARTAG